MKKYPWFIIAIFLLMSLLLSHALDAEESGMEDPESDIQVYVIQIRNAIGNGLREYISRSVRMAQREKADVLLFHIHTPGGAVSATSEIIRTIDDSGIPAIAFVDDEAISAGALITLSCDKVVAAPGGTIGDAQPIPTNAKPYPT